MRVHPGRAGFVYSLRSPAAKAAGDLFFIRIITDLSMARRQAVIVPVATMSLTGCPLRVPLKWNTTLMGEGP